LFETFCLLLRFFEMQRHQHLADFISAYNFGRRLKTLKGLTPYEFICKAWAAQPERFKLNPLQQMPGLNIYDLDPGGKSASGWGHPLCAGSEADIAAELGAGVGGSMHE
jgi:hypothetical protein